MPDAAPRYWTRAFLERLVVALNDDLAFTEVVQALTDRVILRCFDTPDGHDVEAAYVFEGGQVVDVEVWREEAPCWEMRNDPFDRDEALARATASYALWAKLDRGEKPFWQALISPDCTLEGPRRKRLTHLTLFKQINAVAATVEKTY